MSFQESIFMGSSVIFCIIALLAALMWVITRAPRWTLWVVTVGTGLLLGMNTGAYRGHYSYVVKVLEETPDKMIPYQQQQAEASKELATWLSYETHFNDVGLSAPAQIQADKYKQIWLDKKQEAEISIQLLKNEMAAARADKTYIESTLYYKWFIEED